MRRPSHRGRLAALGAGTTPTLAAAIRSGGVDARIPEVAAVLAGSVADELHVANPRHLGGA